MSKNIQIYSIVCNSKKKWNNLNVHLEGGDEYQSIIYQYSWMLCSHCEKNM